MATAYPLNNRGLPTEVLDHILAFSLGHRPDSWSGNHPSWHANNRTSTLSTWTAINSQCRGLALPRLYREIYIVDAFRAGALARTLSERKGLAGMVKQLHLVKGAGYGAPELVGLCNGLQVLTYEGASWDNAGEDEEQQEPVLATTLPDGVYGYPSMRHLRSLVLDTVNIGPMPGCTTVTDLTLIDVRHPEQDASDVVDWFPGVTTLRYRQRGTLHHPINDVLRLFMPQLKALMLDRAFRPPPLPPAPDGTSTSSDKPFGFVEHLADILGRSGDLFNISLYPSLSEMHVRPLDGAGISFNIIPAPNPPALPALPPLKSVHLCLGAQNSTLKNWDVARLVLYLKSTLHAMLVVRHVDLFTLPTWLRDTTEDQDGFIEAFEKEAGVKVGWRKTDGFFEENREEMVPPIQVQIIRIG